MNALAKSMDAMLKLFNEAAKDLSVEKKLDEIINQNKVIIGKLAALSNSNSDFTPKQKQQPSFNFPRPSFQPAPQPNFQQPPEFQKSFNEPKLEELDELSGLKELEQQRFEEPFNKPIPRQQGPIAMPSIPFSSFREPKRKGLFGRLRQ